MSPTLRTQEALPRAALCSMLEKQLGSVGEDARKGCIHALRGPLYQSVPKAALSLGDLESHPILSVCHTVIYEHPWAAEQTGYNLAGGTWVRGQMSVQESGLQNELCWLKGAGPLGAQAESLRSK